MGTQALEERGQFIRLVAKEIRSKNHRQLTPLTWAFPHSVSPLSDPERRGGYLCCFCGKVASYGADFLMLHVASNGVEQFFASHRACFVNSLAEDEAIRGGPLFDD